MKIYFLLCIFVIISGFGFCQSNKTKKKDDEIVVITQSENRKYNLTATFYGIDFRYGDEDELGTKIITYIVFKDNKTGVEVRYKLPKGDNTEEEDGLNSIIRPDFYFTGIWSPDEEYIVLPIDPWEGFAVFEAKNALNSIKENKYFDNIKVRQSEGGFFWHEFEKWEDNSIFSFRAGLDGDMFAFKYNAAKDELYCYRTKCEEFEVGYNKKGKIKPIKKGDIATKTEH